MKTIITIETAPLSDSEIEAIMPEFKAPSNYKDAAKITEYINERKAAFKKEAKFNPMSGRIVGIGVLPEDGGPTVIASLDPEMEVEMIRAICKEINGLPIGWYTRDFLVPFAARRAWKNDIGLDINVAYGCTDLAVEWQAGAKGVEFPSLDSVAKFLCDIDPVDEPEVDELLRDGKHEEAAAQIVRKLNTIKAVAEKMGAL